MNDTDLIDRAWREGLGEVADYGSRAGVTGRVEARRRAYVARRRVTFTAVIALVCLVVGAGAIGAAGLRNGGHTTRPAGNGTNTPQERPIATIHIEVLPTLQLRAVLDKPGDFPPVTYAENGVAVLPLPRPGPYRFVFSGASGHEEELDGHLVATGHGHDVAMDVRLAAGRYVLECRVAGHAEAGEKMVILVNP